MSWEPIKEWRKNNPEKWKAQQARAYAKRVYDRVKTRNERLKSNYGITHEEYDALLASQKGVCAICGKPETLKWRETVRDLAVDYDHATSKIRGLLCSRCNQGLGHFKDDPDLLRKALEYLL